MEKVLVYGSLRMGEGNNYLLEGSDFMGEIKFTGFTLHNLGYYPAIVENEENGQEIVGEVWEITNDTFNRLDRLEGYPHYYNRKQIETEFGPAWVYFNNNSISRPIVESGDWKNCTNRM